MNKRGILTSSKEAETEEGYGCQGLSRMMEGRERPGHDRALFGQLRRLTREVVGVRRDVALGVFSVS